MAFGTLAEEDLLNLRRWFEGWGELANIIAVGIMNEAHILGCDEVMSSFAEGALACMVLMLSVLVREAECLIAVPMAMALASMKVSLPAWLLCELAEASRGMPVLKIQLLSNLLLWKLSNIIKIHFFIVPAHAGRGL